MLIRVGAQTIERRERTLQRLFLLLETLLLHLLSHSVRELLKSSSFVLAQNGRRIVQVLVQTVQRRVVMIVHAGHVRVVVQQQVDHLVVAVRASVVQRRYAVATSSARVVLQRAVLQQLLDDLGMAMVASLVDRQPAAVVSRIDRASILDQLLHLLQVALNASPVQFGFALLVALVAVLFRSPPPAGQLFVLFGLRIARQIGHLT